MIIYLTILFSVNVFTGYLGKPENDTTKYNKIYHPFKKSAGT
jgi:hypothetical protein